MRLQNVVKLLRNIKAVPLIGIICLTTFLVNGCSKSIKPDEVYCLASSDKAFYERLRVNTHKITASSGFSYYDEGSQVWSDLSHKRSAYDPSSFIDLLVKNNDTYVLMLNNIGEPRGRVRVSVFGQHSRINKVFARKLKRAFLGGVPSSIPVSATECSS